MEDSNCNSGSASVGGVGSSANAGCRSEDVGDNQDEEPSLEKIQPVETELESFRLQWKREIEKSPSKVQKNSRDKGKDTSSQDESIEEKAKYLFLGGVQAERQGKLQDAIALYRRAIQLVPDIEFRIDENMVDYIDEYYEESEDESTLEDNDSDDEDSISLMEKFQKISSKAGTSRICQPKQDQMMSHISSLPPEIFMYILKWVVTQNLDVVSLEQISLVCRGFYLCARDPEIWRLICQRTWDMYIDNSNKYGGWRNMFIERPHLCFNGTYISKTTYVRYGESSFQDSSYRPCFLVEYYRYLRFFPDGVVLMLTTPDDPYQSVYQLRNKKCKNPNVMSGRYKLVGNTIMAVVKKRKNEASSSNYYRYRRQRQANLEEPYDQTFHLELQIKNYKKKINCQLGWTRYSIHLVYKNGEETVTDFEVAPSNFPCFWFSRVKSYTAESESPLK